MHLILKNNDIFKPVGYIYEVTPEQAPLLRTIYGNRMVDPANVKKIFKSYLKNGYLNIPLIVNQMLGIIDGQHRLMAWIQFCEKFPEKAFNLLFNVSPNYTIEDAQKLNTLPPKKWSLDAYIHSLKDENINYSIVFEFMEKYKFGSTASLLLISGKGSRLCTRDFDNFRHKGFVVDNDNLAMAHKIATIMTNHLSSYPKMASDKFITAYRRLYGIEKYDHDRFISNWSNMWKDELDGRQSEDSLLHGLVAIHNAGSNKGRILLDKKKKTILMVASK